ncbi:MAG TPA: hypothetical protein VL333_13185 [Candidatus Saccharimonadales bacterium]|jgi:hypothetical protein|nr:hypothetical protein [Candidatus Saccharimonadales bacterium]
MPDNIEELVQRNAREIMDEVKRAMPAHFSPRERHGVTVMALSRLKEVADTEGLRLMPLDRAAVVIGVACWEPGRRYEL